MADAARLGNVLAFIERWSTPAIKLELLSVADTDPRTPGFVAIEACVLRDRQRCQNLDLVAWVGRHVVVGTQALRKLTDPDDYFSTLADAVRSELRAKDREDFGDDRIIDTPSAPDFVATPMCEVMAHLTPSLEPSSIPYGSEPVIIFSFPSVSTLDRSVVAATKLRAEAIVDA